MSSFPVHTIKTLALHANSLPHCPSLPSPAPCRVSRVPHCSPSFLNLSKLLPPPPLPLLPPPPPPPPPPPCSWVLSIRLSRNLRHPESRLLPRRKLRRKRPSALVQAVMAQCYSKILGEKMPTFLVHHRHSPFSPPLLPATISKRPPRLSRFRFHSSGPDKTLDRSHFPGLALAVSILGRALLGLPFGRT